MEETAVKTPEGSAPPPSSGPSTTRAGFSPTISPKRNHLKITNAKNRSSRAIMSNDAVFVCTRKKSFCVVCDIVGSTNFNRQICKIINRKMRLAMQSFINVSILHLLRQSYTLYSQIRAYHVLDLCVLHNQHPASASNAERHKEPSLGFPCLEAPRYLNQHHIRTA